MIDSIFKSVLVSTLSGSVLAFIIIMLKMATKRFFGYKWNYYIWLIVLLAMIFPFSVKQYKEFDISLEKSSLVLTDEVDVKPNKDNGIQQNNIQTNTDKNIKVNSTDIIEKVWISGVFVALLINIISYIKMLIKIRKHSVLISLQEIKRYTKRKLDVKVCKNISSPFIIGAFKPVLVLPDIEFTDIQLANILRHEITHLKRNDIIYKWFSVFVKCIHWFNPVIYYVSRQINIECEISCDLSVVEHMNKTEKIDYVNTIIDIVSINNKSRNLPVLKMIESKKMLERRFIMIKNNKKTGKIMSAISFLMAVVILSSTAFANGIFSGIIKDEYAALVTNNGQSIEFKNKPFIKNGELYVPLRETFENLDFLDNEESSITWDNGDITITLVEKSQDLLLIYNYKIIIGQSQLIQNAKPTLLGQDLGITVYMTNAPILKNSVTYVPYEYIRHIISNMTNDLEQQGNVQVVVEAYIKKELGMVVQIPGDWDCTIKDNPNSSDGVIIETSWGGIVCFIFRETLDEWEKYKNESPVEQIVLAQNDKYVYTMIMASDVQYDINNKQQIEKYNYIRSNIDKVKIELI